MSFKTQSFHSSSLEQLSGNWGFSGSCSYWWLGPYFRTRISAINSSILYPYLAHPFSHDLSCVCLVTCSAFITPGSWDNPVTFIRESNGICKPDGPDFTSFSDLNLQCHKETVCVLNMTGKKMCLGYKTLCISATKLKPLTHEMKIFGWSRYLCGWCFIETSFIKIGDGKKWADVFLGDLCCLDTVC